MFFFVAIGVVAVLHLYLWKRLVIDTTAPGTRPRRIGTAALTVLAALLVAAMALGTRVTPDVARWFAWPGYLWLALFFYLLVALLVLEVPRLALRPWVRWDSTPDHQSTGTANDHGTKAGVGIGADLGAAPVPHGVSRRKVLARGSAALAGAVATGFVGYGITVAMGPPSVTRVPITLRRLDPRAAGCRIALISDVHLGPIVGRSFTERIVELVNAQRPDIVAIAGDLVDGEVAALADAAAPLAGLRSTHGTFFVTGNHEYYSGYEQWVRHVRTLGIRPLRNERVEIRHHGGVFDLAGINDATAYQWQDPGDVGKALAGRDPGRAVVLLAHQPVDVGDAVAHDVDLMLAGHTHGGQLSPFELLVSLQQGAVAGTYRLGDTTMYVTRGAGFWGPPVRVGAPPEISIIELRAA